MTSTAQTGTALTGERADLLETLGKHRYFLRFTCRDLDDEQANRRTTASALALGGLVRHVAETEEQWVGFILSGPDAFGPAEWGEDVEWSAEGGVEVDPAVAAGWEEQFRLAEGETLAGVLERYEQVARRTDELVATLPDLDAAHPLPEAPWFEQGARWSARRVLLHIVAETAQHAGHADIIRESLDGAKSMG